VASILECLLGAAAPQHSAAPTAAAPSAGATPKILHASISDDCLCAIKLGADAATACCSPKACSDVTPATSGAQLDGPELAQPQADVMQPLVLLSALLESKLLPQAHRLLQQLPPQGCSVSDASAGAMASGAVGSMARQGSASSAVQVPTPRGSSQHYGKDAGARVSTRWGGRYVACLCFQAAVLTHLSYLMLWLNSTWLARVQEHVAVFTHG
jgi:hypothetical protein